MTIECKHRRSFRCWHDPVDCDVCNDVRQDIIQQDYATRLGYEVSLKKPGDPYNFSKGRKVIWEVYGGWVCADIVDGFYCNHRAYGNLKEALTAEK